MTVNDEVLDERTSPDAEFLYIDISGVTHEDGVVTKDAVVFGDAPSRARRIVREGDVIISTVRTYLKAIARIHDPESNLIVSTGFAVIRPKTGIDAGFLGYAVSSNNFVDEVISQSTGVSYPAISALSLVSIPVAVPCHSEQKAIAAFLDWETSKIDALVAEQRRLIQLLKEKRQAVISHAVTKGLDPDAPTKPSGIDWLGDVPAHWRTARCGRYLQILSGFAFPSVGFTDDYVETKLLRGVNVGVGRLRWEETVYWQRKSGDGLDEYLLRAGDIVVGMDRPLISDGLRVARVSDADLPCLLLQRVARLRPDSELNSEYILQLLSSQMFVAHFLPEMTGVSVPHISPDQIASFVIPLPPIEEQEAIASTIKAENERTNDLVRQAQYSIELLMERRSALISAAVTGQIDVRILVAA